MSAEPPLAVFDSLVLCYCTNLTVRELRETCAAGRWPLPGKERTGKLCTGCMGDLLYCLRQLGVTGTRPLTLESEPDT